MTTCARILAGLVAAGTLVGCTEPMAGRSQPLGTVEYGLAFATAREVMAEYFSIASADPDTGIIQSRPKPVAARAERLLGGSPARQVARMRLRRQGEQVVAHLWVALQRQGSAVLREMRVARDKYDSVPNETPAEIEAATTPEQNETWRTRGYDHRLERTILTELYKALNPGAGKE